MLIARSHAQHRDWPQPRNDWPQRRDWRHPPSNCAGHAHAKKLRCGRAQTRVSQPYGRTPAIDVARLIDSATRLPAFLRRLHTETTRHRTREPRDMLRLLIVALPLVFALPAAFDNQETNVIQFEVQSTLQLEVRSPPESHPLRPAATREQHTTAPPHTPLRTHNTQAHTSRCTSRGNRARARRSIPRSTSSPRSSPTSSSQEHQPITRRCDHRPC